MRERFYKASSPLNGYRGKSEFSLRFAVFLAGTVMAASFSSGCAGIRVCDQGDDWLGSDKAKHFAASALIGGGVTAIAGQEMDSGDAAGIGMATALGAGVGKEIYDVRVKKTCASWKDLAWDCLGASVGVTIAAQASD